MVFFSHFLLFLKAWPWDFVAFLQTHPICLPSICLSTRQTTKRLIFAKRTTTTQTRHHQPRLWNWKEFNGGNYGFQLFWCHPESIRKWNRIRLNEQNYSVKFDQDKVSMILSLLEIQLDEPQKSNGIMWTFSSIVVTNDIDRWHHSWSSSSRDNNCTLLAHTQVFGGSWNDKKVEIVYRVITWTIKVEISIWKTFLLQNIF